MTHLAIIGKGAIARSLFGLLEPAGVDRVTFLVRSGTAPEDLTDLLARGGRCVDSLAALIEAAPDIVIEAAGQSALAQYGPAILAAGIPLVAASVGALADDDLFAELRAAARRGHTRLHLPSGAIGGIDALAALNSAGPLSLRYTGTKPPRAWPEGSAPEGVVFEGTAREAARKYPKNANVAAILALAGPGLDDTEVRLLADPAAQGNTHAWQATGASGSISVTLNNAPVAGNAATSALTVHSLLRCFRNLTHEVSL